MHYLYNKTLKNHWEMITKMVDENYLPEDHNETTLMMGLICYKSVAEIKKEMNTNRVIVYQTEPLLDSHWFDAKTILRNLEGADEIWDYDLQNIELLRKHGIEAKFRPPVMTNSLKKIKNRINPEIDVLFYGSFTKRRQKMIDDLYNGCSINYATDDAFIESNFVWLYLIDDYLLDEYMGRSKIILSINPHDGDNRQQQTRLFYALNNNKCVLSEKCAINYYGDQIYQYNDSHQLKDSINFLLTDDKWRNKPANHENSGIFTKTPSKIAIFYHLYQYGNWAHIFNDQLIHLQQCGLFDKADYIHVGINGPNSLPYDVARIHRVKHNTHIDLEADTLYDLWNFCKTNPDYKVLYFHAKGVTWSNTEMFNPVWTWRKYMEYFTFGRWKECIDLLDEYDCVGTEWEDEAHVNDTKLVSPHYAGNFWWANASYINKLDPNYLYIRNDWSRWQGEFWIGTGKPNYYNFHSLNKNKYGVYIDPVEYVR